MEKRYMTYPIRAIDRFFLFFYSAIWTLGLPAALFYLWYRGRKEPLYFSALSERFGGGGAHFQGAIWIHAASLGELRAARSLISALLARGEKILVTTMTPAGRLAADQAFGVQIKNEYLAVKWIPFDAPWIVKRFLRRHRPKFGMILEIELWPGLMVVAKNSNVPMIMAQAQYPICSFLRDKPWPALRRHLVQGFALIMAKSAIHAARFQDCGATNVTVMGELRFDLPISSAHLAAAKALLKYIKGRPVYCFASTHPQEDALLEPILKGLKESGKNPFFIYVPRHPAEFDATWDKLKRSGFKMIRRSQDLSTDLTCGVKSFTGYDGIFGDSIGEINFYFELSDHVFMGDSFIDEGSHNIIEPLRLLKTVAVGPSIWGIEYPATEALAAEILTQHPTPNALLDHWLADASADESAKISKFVDEHGGATQRAITLLKTYGFLL